MKIEEKDIPDRFYKYRSLSADSIQYTLDIIENCRLYWPSPLDFNDPFDCSPAHEYRGTLKQKIASANRSAEILGMGKSRKERRQMRMKALKRKPSEITDIMKQSSRNLMANISVCSLSKVHNNILMWSHYADSHSGICVGFEPSEAAIDFLCAFEVIYMEKRPLINLIEKIKGEDALNDILLTKSKLWEYESEWRMIDQQKEKGTRLFPSKPLKEIYLGCRISSQNKSNVLNSVIKSPTKPKIWQAIESKDEFGLEFTELSI